MKNAANNVISSNLSAYQQYYWRDPDHCRKLQRNKYIRYPERIKEQVAKWDSENVAYIKEIRRINSLIYYYTHKKSDPIKVRQLVKAKDAIKKEHRVSNSLSF